MINTTVHKRDRILSFSIFLFFLIQILNGSIKLIFEIPPAQYGLISNLFGAVYVLYFLNKALPIIYNRSKNVLISSYLVFLVLYTVSLVLVSFRGEKTDWLWNSYILWTLIFWIPIGISAYSIFNYKILYDVLIKYSYIYSIILGIVFLKSIIFMSEEQEMFYSMFFSYLLLIPAIFHLSFYQMSRNKIVLFLFILEIIMILLIGSRGAIICLFSFVIIKFLISNKSFSSKLTSVVCITIGFLFLYFNLHKINDLFLEYNIRSRTLAKFSSSDSEILSDREISWKAAIELIEEKPILGYGLGGDYYPMLKKTSSIYGNRGITSPHNGFLQLMMQFGAPIGLLIGLWVFFSIMGIFKNIFFHHRELLVISYAIFVVPAMTVGDGVFIKPGIALYIYLIFKLYFNNKNSYEHT